MQDQYTGQAGTFIVDPEKGERIPIEQYEAEQAAKADMSTQRVGTSTAKTKPEESN